jgi:hypothetical protein
VRTMTVVGVCLCIAGVVWVCQGVGLIGGSFMSGQAIWAVIGAIALVLGTALLRGATRARSSRNDAEEQPE